MKKILSIVLGCSTILLFGCGTTDEAKLRKIVQEELRVRLQRGTYPDSNVVGPYSPAQQAGGFLFVSGQIGMNWKTGALEAQDIESETRQVLENLTAVLENAGYDTSDVIATTVYLKDMNDYQKMNLIYGGYFPEDSYPARTAVQVAGLPRNARIEISAIAYKP